MSTMWFSLGFLLLSSAIPSYFGFSIQNGESFCPPPESVKPCTCSKVSGRVTALCRDISSQREIKKAFSKNPDWNLQDVHFDECVMDYIPSSIVRTASFQTLNVTSSTLVSLFDSTPDKTPEINIYLYDVKILRGVQWEFVSNSTLMGFGAWNVDIAHFGNPFKEHMPQVVKYLWFENTKTMSITHQAFQNIINVEIFTLMGGSIKKLSRDMFPRPWNIKFWSLSNQKLAALPKDMFEDFPKLGYFSVEKNFLTTISEEVFSKKSERGHGYVLIDNPIVCNCEIKWITTSGKPNHFFGTCAEPESFKGRELKTLSQEDFKFCR